MLKSELRVGGAKMTGGLKLAIMVACAAMVAGCSATARSNEGSAVLSESYEGALPIQTQLIIGTLQLEQGDLAVSAEQAAELIPLWKAVRSLSSSDTAAEVEIEAVLNQIQETMTAAQLQAIAAMQLTQQDLFGAIQELGIGPGSQAEGDRASSQASGGEFGGPPGGFVFEGGPPEGFAGGGRPEGGPAPGFAENLSPDQIATAQAARAGQGLGGGRAGLFLIDPLLEMLEAKAGS